MISGLDKKKRVGWVIADQLERGIWTREASFIGGGVGLARYYWLSQYINQHVDEWQYESYRPWRRYDVVIFLKSMGPRAIKLMNRLQSRGIACVFDANVNYFDRTGTEYYTDMLPSQKQGEQAREMVQKATTVIADSQFITEKCREYNPQTAWIPDTVDMSEAIFQHWQPDSKRLRLLWSGQAVKLFELLAAEEALLAYKDRLDLVLVTNDLSAFNRLYPKVRARLEALLDALSVTVIPYQSMRQLFSVYAEGGVFISPRFLDNRYNFGHTEWKLTLAMACGRIALCSPVPSYERVAERSHGSGIRVCENMNAWNEAFEELLTGSLDWKSESIASRDVVDQYYSSSAISIHHLKVMASSMFRHEPEAT